MRETQAREGVVNGLTLRVKHGALWHYPDVSFHKESIARAEHGFTPQLRRRKGGRNTSEEFATLLRGDEGVLECGAIDLQKLIEGKAHFVGVKIFVNEGGVKHRGIVSGETDRDTCTEELW